MHRLRLPATMSSLRAFRTFVLDALERWNLGRTLFPRVELVLEEVLTNIIRYAYPEGNGEVEVGCCVDADGAFRMVVEDSGSPFDPHCREDPDLELDLLERPVGGLGVFLVKRMVSRMQYERRDNRNILTLCFEVPEHDGTACSHEAAVHPK